jgi:transposase
LRSSQKRPKHYRLDPRAVSTVCGPRNCGFFPTGGFSFERQKRWQLIPVLKPGDVGVPDSSSGHKSTKARKAIKAAGAYLFFLPPYSCDLNPIEQVFAKFKRLQRKEEARTAEALWKAAGRVLNALTPHEGSNYLRNCGYASV